jgi:radical SAM protein with 4Fe4S-binding SPASM domain
MLALKGNANFYLKNEQIVVVYSFFENGMQVYACKNEALYRYLKIYKIKPLTTALISSLLQRYKTEEKTVINIELTKGCNHTCMHCYNEASKDVNTLSLEDFIRVVEKIKIAYKDFSLRLSGGEPTLNPEIVSMCDYAMKCSQLPTHTIITNGTMPNELFHKILATGIRMQLSVYGFEYSTYRIFTKGDFSLYTNFRNNLHSINETERSQVELIYYYSSITKKDVNVFEDFVKENGISYRYSRIMPLGRAATDTERWALLGDDIYRVKSKTFETQRFRDNLCENNRINICFDGSVTPCPFWTGNSKYVMGNIFSDNLTDMVNHKEFVSYRSKTVDDVAGCNNCPMRYLCTGGCRAIIESSINWGSQKPKYCNLEKISKRLDLEMRLVQMPYPGLFIIG